MGGGGGGECPAPVLCTWVFIVHFNYVLKTNVREEHHCHHCPGEGTRAQSRPGQCTVSGKHSSLGSSLSSAASLLRDFG